MNIKKLIPKKRDKDEWVYLRIGKELKAKLKRLRLKHGLTMNQLVALILEEATKDHK